MVRFFVESPREHDVPKLVEQVQLLEQLGYEAVMFGEHVNQPDLVLSSRVPLLAALAMVTSRIKLGTMLLIMPMYHPVHLARDIAVVDHISQGRVIVGVGLGYQKPDFDAFGIPFAQRVSRFDEGLELLRRAWTEERFSFYGKRFEVHDAGITPRPYQSPHPPILVAAGSDEGVKRAARGGDGVVFDSWQHLDTVKRNTDLYRDLVTKRGRRPSITLTRNILIAESREQALRVYGEGLLTAARYSWSHGYGATDFRAWTEQGRRPEEITVEEVIRDRVLCGSPEEVADEVRMWLDITDADYINLRFPRLDDHTLVTDAWRLFAERVMPQFAVV